MPRRRIILPHHPVSRRRHPLIRLSHQFHPYRPGLRWARVLADPTADASRLEHRHFPFVVEPNRTRSQRTGLNTEPAFVPHRPNARLLVDDGKSHLDIVQQQPLKSPAGADLHALQPIAYDTRLGFWIDPGGSTQPLVASPYWPNGICGTGRHAVSAALARFQEGVFRQRTWRT